MIDTGDGVGDDGRFRPRDFRADFNGVAAGHSHILGKAAVPLKAGAGRVAAVIFLSPAAGVAETAAFGGIDGYMVAGGQAGDGRAHRYHLTGDFVARDVRQRHGWHQPIGDFQVGGAQPVSHYLDQRLPVADGRLRDFPPLQGAAELFQYHCLHRVWFLWGGRQSTAAPGLADGYFIRKFTGSNSLLTGFTASPRISRVVAPIRGATSLGVNTTGTTPDLPLYRIRV